MFLKLKHIVKDDLNYIFKLSDAKRHWSIPFLAALCIGLPMFIGYILGYFKESLTVSLGGLVILYLPVNENVIGRTLKLLFCSFGFISAYFVGVFFSFNFYVSYLSFGILTAIIYLISKFYHLKPPGNFFFVMMAAMACGLPYSLTEIPFRIGLITIGTFFSSIIAIVFSLLVLKPNINKDLKESLSKFHVRKELNYFEAVIIGIFMSTSFFIAHYLGLNNPYWVPISCLAVMQGINAKHIWQRGFYRITGTTIGMLLCWIILSFFKTQLEIILAIMILQFTVEMLIVKNYFFTILFITPMTILLSEAGSPVSLDPDILILARMNDVLLGSFLGIIGGWLIYNDQLRFKMVKYFGRTSKKTNANF